MTHPWRTSDEAKAKLREAKKEAKKLRQRKWHKEHYDEFKKFYVRTKKRQAAGIPAELPKMKPWDYEKERVS